MAAPQEDEGSKEVEAVEDLMREHGVLRRALLVYAEAATRLESGHGEVPLSALSGILRDYFVLSASITTRRRWKNRTFFSALIKGDGRYGASGDDTEAAAPAGT